ncbi:MAG: GntR family transcriptional regulator [Syntrophaceticus sp.]|jgi:DNA-binding GntR family transcriptional regulator|nr:GntR family transcriptional regulator [Syntrophaceticus sp.]MDD3315148.1 GntR family transcriptional regulator [Syntrophaceticus sp.]MDD4359256.1 GntR family transcriptional regulator [Syntrophaceticus sp.]MDD4782104.1 GntR family transcriptional regulator [Syntrophaceticus sp.]
MATGIKSEKLFEVLKSRIVHLEYSPGQVLNEADIADEFDLSRTPVRKAFEQLKNVKLMEIIPRYGAQVAPIDFKYMKSVFEVDRQLEGFAARLAAERMTDEKIADMEAIIERLKSLDIEKEYKQMIIEDEKFHEIIFKSSGNPCLVDILDDLHMHTERLWFYVQKDITDANLFLDTMPQIVQAIKEKDADRAEQGAQRHIDVFVERIKQELL